MTPQPDPLQSELLHATCVAVAGRGLLIVGPSGSGKSALALRLIVLGARLVADDRTVMLRRGAALHAACPPPIRGLIEARGVGLLRLPADPEVQLCLAVDLGQTETRRLPERRTISYLGCALDLVLGSQSAHFPQAMLLLLTYGRPE